MFSKLLLCLFITSFVAESFVQENKIIQDILAFMETQPDNFSPHGLIYYLSNTDVSSFIVQYEDYTFFLPKRDAFRDFIPMDGGDPFIANDQLRITLLKNIIFLGKVDIDTLNNGDIITNLDGSSLTITERDGVKYFDNDNKIEKVISERDGSKATIYLLNKIPVITHQDVFGVL